MITILGARAYLDYLNLLDFSDFRPTEEFVVEYTTTNTVTGKNNKYHGSVPLAYKAIENKIDLKNMLDKWETASTYVQRNRYEKLVELCIRFFEKNYSIYYHDIVKEV